MKMLDNPAVSEIISIINDGTQDTRYRWRAVMHANGKDIEVEQLMSINFDRDYIGAYVDEITATLGILPGKFSEEIYPYRDNLEVTLIRERGGAVGAPSVPGTDAVAQRFRATLYDTHDEELEAKKTIQTDKEAENRQGPRYIKFQLLDLAIEQIRLMSTGGIFRNACPADVVRYLLGEVSRKANVDDEYAVKGVDLADGYSQKKRKHVIIPHHTKLTKVPAYVQEHAGGVYREGLGRYFQNQKWYVYAPYSLSRVPDAPNLLTVINLPSRVMPGVERTYRRKGTQVYIASTGEVIHKDLSDNAQLNQGNGVRFTKGENIMGDFGVVNDNKLTVSRKSNTVEVQLTQRDNELDHITMSEERISSNVSFQLSRLAPRNGSFVQWTWENANTRLIHPGMPVRFLTLINEKIKEFYGTVIAADYHIEWKGQTPLTGEYITTAAITLFIQRNGEVL